MDDDTQLPSSQSDASADPLVQPRWSDHFWRFVVGYCIAMLVLVGMSFTTGDSLWSVRAFGYVRDIALGVALLPLPLALWSRRRRTVLLQLLCAVSLLWIPASSGTEPRIAPPGSTEVTVMTYNLGDGLAGPTDLMPFLKQSGADIVGLQEVTPGIAAAIENHLASVYPYRVVRGLGIPGKALLSKYPIVEHHWLESNPERPDLVAVVDINGMRTAVIVAHPPPPHLTASGIVSRPGGDEQFAALVETIANIRGPLLVLGDLNITRYHDRYQQLEAVGLVDVFADVGSGSGLTTPVRLPVLDGVSQTLGDAPITPLLRIDYIWATSHWYPLEAWVGSDTGSDHLPVMARVALCCTS